MGIKSTYSVTCGDVILVKNPDEDKPVPFVVITHPEVASGTALMVAILGTDESESYTVPIGTHEYRGIEEDSYADFSTCIDANMKTVACALTTDETETVIRLEAMPEPVVRRIQLAARDCSHLSPRKQEILSKTLSGLATP